MKVRKEKTGFLKLFILAVTILIVQNNFAQAPAGYYDSATGSGYTLKTQLYNIIKGHTERSYTQLWTDFKTTDKKANGYVWDMYSDIPAGTPAYNFTFITDQCGSYGGEGDCYNREHSFPKSWFNDASPMYSDLFHLYPTDGYVNGKRSNYPFGEVGSASWTSTNGSKLGTSNYPGYTGIVFEPIDEYKGDFARTYFYMATRYENVIATWPGSEMLDGTNDQCFTDWALDLLIDWHNNDPVSSKETNRNNAVYSIQNNRNPFIDHPEYVARIWGGLISNNPPSIAGIILNPASPKSTDPVNVSASITDSDGTINSAILKWGLVSGNLSNTINLTKVSGNTYSTVSAIPAQADGVAVYYKIEATDDSSGISATNQYSYIVNDNIYNIAILDESFTNCSTNGWLSYSVTSNRNWQCGNGQDSINGYGGDAASNDWLISPQINLDNFHNERLSFMSKSQYIDLNNYPAIKVKYSTNYSGSGNPTLATWTELPAAFSDDNSNKWKSSGNVDISEKIGTQVYFAFHYTSTGTGASTSSRWSVKDIKIIGDDISTNNKPFISALIVNPESPLTGQAVTISASITDNDGSISSAKIKWGTVSGSYPNTITMSASGNVFSGVIPSQLAGTTVYFVVEATDNDNSKTTTVQQHYYVSEIPNVAPVISSILISPSSPAEGEAITISASITDSDGSVSSAVINYGSSSGYYSQSVSMTKSGNTFTGSIPSQLAGTTIYFVIEAIDNDSDESVTSENSFFVIAPHNNPPVLSNIQFTPTNPDQNQSVTISAEVADSDGTISYSKIKWGTTSGVYLNYVNMSYGSGFYSGIISGQTGGTTVYFRVVATDDDNDSTITEEYSYGVNTPGNVNPVINGLTFTPLTPTSSQTVSVSATITDSNGSIASAKIKWGTSIGEYPNQILMSNNLSLYSGVIPSQANGTRIYFVVEATDNSGGMSVSSEQNYTVTNPPNINPVITNLAFTPQVPTSSQQVTISATITDADGIITSAVIKWGTGVGTYNNNVLMSKNSDEYIGSIPAQLNNTHVYFIIEASDNEEGISTSIVKDFIVTDPLNILPQITNISFSPEIPTSSQDIIVNADITDVDGTIASATVKWGVASGVYGNAINMIYNSGGYTAIIPAQQNGTRIYFIIEAIDNNSGTNNSTERTFLVTDPPNQAPIISNVQITPEQPTNLDSVLISASITDSDGTISTAILKWKRNAETAIHEEEMVFDGTRFKAYIPVQESGKTVYFIIVAADDDNAQSSYMDGVYSVITSSGIENTELSEAIHIYPNPASEKLNIFFVNNELDICITLLSLDGKTIYIKSIEEVKGEVSLMLNQVNPGMYILQITNQRNKISQKIIIK